MCPGAYRSTFPPFTWAGWRTRARLRPEHVSMGKLGNVNGALHVARTARQILRANGITLESPVIRHLDNLESVVTYEGTADIHALSSDRL